MPIVHKQVTKYAVQCDRCGVLRDDDQDSEEDAIAYASQDDWAITLDRVAYCPKCLL